MSEEELELLVTIDDPVDPPEEDRFHDRAGVGQKDRNDCDAGQTLSDLLAA